MSRRITTDSVRNAARHQAQGRSRTKLALCALLGAALLTPLVSQPREASADKIATLQAQAAHLVDQINHNYDRMDMLDEELNQAQIRIQQLDGQIRDAQRNVDAAKGHADQLRSQLGRRAATLYMQAGSSSLGTVDLSSLQASGARQMYAAATASRDNQLLSGVRNARDAYARRKHTIEQARAQAQAARKDLEQRKHDLQAVNRQQNALLAQTRGALAKAVAEEQARRAAALAAAALAEARRIAAQQAAAAHQAQQQSAHKTGGSNSGSTHSSSGSSGGSGNGSGSSGGSSGGGGSTGGGTSDPGLGSGVGQHSGVERAVQIALAQIGKPYVWGTMGPNTFDCSGLVVYSFSQAGIASLPHSSQGLYASLPHVSTSNMQRGDLVFFGSPIHHVGIYLGGGMMVDAPHTGASVHTTPLYSGLVGAARVP